MSLVSADTNATTLTLKLNVTFTAGFGGNQVVYLAARDQAGDNSGWQASGVWQVPGASSGSIAVGAMSPIHGVAAAEHGANPCVHVYGYQGGIGSGDFERAGKRLAGWSLRVLPGIYRDRECQHTGACG